MKQMKESEFQCLPGKMESHGDKNYLSKLETWIEVDFIQANLMSQSISCKAKADISFTDPRCPVCLVNTLQKSPFHMPKLNDSKNPFVRSEPGPACQCLCKHCVNMPNSRL